MMPNEAPHTHGRPLQAVLLGSYKIPESHSGIQLALSPAGPHAHTTPKVWNAGDGRCKLLLLVSVPSRGAAAAERKDASCVPQVDVWVPAAP